MAASHHLCYEVDDIRAARDRLVAAGARVLGDGEPKTGAHGKPVLFLHPKDFCGTLVELEELSLLNAIRMIATSTPATLIMISAITLGALVVGIGVLDMGITGGAGTLFRGLVDHAVRRTALRYPLAAGGGGGRRRIGAGRAAGTSSASESHLDDHRFGGGVQCHHPAVADGGIVT